MQKSVLPVIAVTPVKFVLTLKMLSVIPVWNVKYATLLRIVKVVIGVTSVKNVMVAR